MHDVSLQLKIICRCHDKVFSHLYASFHGDIVWLVAGADLLCEKSTAGWLGLIWCEKKNTVADCQQNRVWCERKTLTRNGANALAVS